MTHNPGAEYYTPLSTEDPGRRITEHGPEETFPIRSIPYGGSLYFSPAGSNSRSSSQDSYTYTYRYGPPGLAGLLRNRYTFACALFASIGGLTFGYDQGVIANVLVMKDFLERWPGIGPWEKGLMSTSHTFSTFVCVGVRKIRSDRVKLNHVHLLPRPSTHKLD